MKLDRAREKGLPKTQASYVIVVFFPLKSEQGLYTAATVNWLMSSEQQRVERPMPMPMQTGANPSVVEMTTRSDHDEVIRLKDRFPIVIEDVDQTFGNFTEKEARKAWHRGRQYIALKAAAGGEIDTVDEIADVRGAELKLYNGLLRGIGGQERKAVNETRMLQQPLAPQTRGGGLLDRILRRSGAKA